MTRVFLAAGVAALAIAAPATAGPGGHGGNNRQVQVARGGGGGGGQRAARMQAPRMQAPRMQRQAFAQPRMQRQQRFAAIERPQRAERVQMRAERQARPQRVQTRVAERQQMRANRSRAQTRTAQRQQVRANRQQAQTRMAQRQQVRANRQQAQTRMAQRQQMRANRAQAQTRMAQRQQVRANRQQAQTRMAQRQQLRANGAQAQNRMATRQQAQVNGVNRAQNQMAMRQQMQANRMNQGQQARANRIQGAQTLLAQRRALSPDRVATADAFRTSSFANLAVSPRNNVRIVDPVQAVRFVGQPVSTVTNIVPLAALPASVSYLYPDTPNYYYQYGGGYLYQVDRSSSLIDALIPLLAGGFLPGTYLPQPYMASYVPDYYGLNSFYPTSYDYGYGYGNVCNRYAYGVVYQVDCYSGMVENVIPLYAGGYGVGQMLPSAYSYYNVPMQYRSMYYPTADYSYWYAPGAIYQYSPSTSLITSVAALMSPGFTVGQPLPMGYGMYNVPMAYRSTYYDTPNAWYRYNNGYIYQVDPTTMAVTAVVASLLT